MDYIKQSTLQTDKTSLDPSIKYVNVDVRQVTSYRWLPAHTVARRTTRRQRRVCGRRH